MSKDVIMGNGQYDEHVRRMLIFQEVKDGKQLETVNDIKRFDKIISDNKEFINEPVGEKNETALHEAIVTRNIPKAHRLLAHGAEVDVQDALGRTPLFWAAYQANPILILLLLNMNASLHFQDSNGRDCFDILGVYKRTTERKLTVCRWILAKYKIKSQEKKET